MSPHNHKRILKLVGGLEKGCDIWSVQSLGPLFERTVSEVKHDHPVCRHVGYDGVLDGCRRVKVFGVEVERVEHIPADMIALDIEERTLTIRRLGHNKVVEVSRHNIEWKWASQSKDGRTIGEFAAVMPAELTGLPASAHLDFRLTTNAYFAPGKHMQDEIFLVEYDPSWPQKYEETARWLSEALGSDIALRVEHYGSTSIPGMPAKPIIDILVEVPDFDSARERAIPALASPECEYWWYSDHMCFHIRKELIGQRTHHIHMAPADHYLWEGLAFRDYLLSHADEAARYAALKHELADRSRNDRVAYTDGKGEYVRAVTAKALGQK